MNLPVINPLDPEAQFEHDAWTDADKMRVLADRLLEEEAIEPFSEEKARQYVALAAATGSAYVFDHNVKDYALFRLEADVRGWLMRDCGRGFELHVEGRWPDQRFVVLYRRSYESYEIPDPNTFKTGPSERLAFRGAPVEGQPRLLRPT